MLKGQSKGHKVARHIGSRLHNSETDRQVSFKFCTNYLLLQGTCAAQSGVTYWPLKLHNSETDRQVSFKCCGNYLLLQGTCAALFTKIGQADWKQKYDAFLAIKCKMELKCIPIAEISPSCRKSRSPNPSALSEF